jgi:hypothetical protein
VAPIPNWPSPGLDVFVVGVADCAQLEGKRASHVARRSGLSSLTRAAQINICTSYSRWCDNRQVRQPTVAHDARL